MDRTSPRRWIPVALALALVGAATLVPAPPTGHLMITCIFCGDQAAADAVVNVALYLPLGFALALATGRGGRGILIAACLSLAIEAIQLVIPGRDASIGDVITNVAGASAGVAILRFAAYGLRTSQRTATLFSVVSGLGAAFLVGLTGWLLTPSFPEAVYYGQWTPNLAHLEWYRGRVLTARIADVALPSRRLENSAYVRTLMLAGLPIAVRAVAGPPVPGLASLFALVDERQREVLLVGPDRTDLVLRIRTRARALQLDQPDLRIPKALASIAPGDTLDIVVRSRDGSWCVEVNRSPSCDLGFTPGSGWAMFAYLEHTPIPLKHALGALWLGAWLAPVGFFARRRGDLIGGGALVGAALVLVPIATVLLPPTGPEWLGAVFGLGAGNLLGRRLRAALIGPR